MIPQSSGGKIITFYSYKGGTGRTMALANVAWLLAANGRRVLAVDWDLEAPGLHRYFLPFLDDPNLEQTNGLVEMVTDYLILTTGANPDRAPGVTDTISVADPRRYASALQFDFERDGALHLLSAGRHDDRYAQRVRGLDWNRLYTDFGGREFILSIADKMRTEYDYILIDSRTGVADVSGICTMELPDQVVLCFTYNRQSVEGAAAVARSVMGYSQSHGRKIYLLPLPTRVIADVEGLHEARDFAQAALWPYLPQLSDREALLMYWDSAEVPHYPAYGFEETLATFRERAGGRNNLLSDMEWLTGQICERGAPLPLPRMPREVRERYLHRFRLRDPRRAALDEALQAEPAAALRLIRSMTAEAAGERGDFAWRRSLARALEDVARSLAEKGNREDAVAATLEEVAIRRKLTAEAPDDHRPALAGSLNNLAIRLSEVGRRADALGPAQEAVEIYRALAARHPDAYEPALALSLSVLADRLEEAGRVEEASAADEDAVRTMARAFLGLPQAWADRMMTILRDYLRRAEALGREPDGELLGPIVEVLMALQAEAGRDDT